MIKKLVYGFAINFFGFLLIFWLFDDKFYIDPTVVNTSDKLKILVLAAILLAIINTFIKPILKILSFPFALMTLGLFYFVLNVFVLGLIFWIIPEMRVDSLLSLILAAVLLSILNNLEHKLLKH